MDVIISWLFYIQYTHFLIYLLRYSFFTHSLHVIKPYQQSLSHLSDNSAFLLLYLEIYQPVSPPHINCASQLRIIKSLNIFASNNLCVISPTFIYTKPFCLRVKCRHRYNKIDNFGTLLIFQRV